MFNWLFWKFYVDVHVWFFILFLWDHVFGFYENTCVWLVNIDMVFFILFFQGNIDMNYTIVHKRKNINKQYVHVKGQNEFSHRITASSLK